MESNRGEKRRKLLGHRSTTVLVVLLFVLYSRVTRAVFSIFDVHDASVGDPRELTVDSLGRTLGSKAIDQVFLLREDSSIIQYSSVHMVGYHTGDL